MKRKEITTRHGANGLTEGEVLAHLAELREPANIRQIAQGMSLKHHGRRVLPKIMAKLRRQGDVEEARGRYRLAGRGRGPVASARSDAAGKGAAEPPIGRKDDLKVDAPPRRQVRDSNLIAGRIVAHRDGYGFVVPDKPVAKMTGDLFIGRDHMADAMNGDKVLARIDRRYPDGRAEGRIVQILERRQPTVVGLFRYGPQTNVVLPYDTRILHELVIPPGQELTPELRDKVRQLPGGEAAHRRARLPQLDGAVVNVELTRYPRGGLAPVGRVIEVLGRPGELGVDVEIIIRKHHLPHVFPGEVLAETRAVPQEVGERDLRGREDFRKLPIVTIDGETARDFDDAVCVVQHRNGAYQLHVHIADVAHYVRPDSPLDREARLRGTSVYFPNRAVPMLPEELSNGICSLNPQVDRLVMSVLMEFSKEGEMTHAEFTPGVIRSVQRMTYTNVYRVFEGDSEATVVYRELVGEFTRMKSLALLLNKRRYARGSIDFDLPEPIIEFDDHGRMTSIGRSVRNIAHRIIEEFMLAANEAVARYLDRRGIASLHRVHEKPDPKKVLEFEEVARTFGYSLGVSDLTERRVPVRHGVAHPPSRGERRGHGRMRLMDITLPSSDEVDIRPTNYQRLVEKIAGKPEERILSYLMLRSLRQARYAVDSLGHFALATGDYTHFTSPIRRYPDLIVHRVLKWALDNPTARFEGRPSSTNRASVSRDELGPSKRPGSNAPQESTLGPYRNVELDEIAEESSDAERRADTAERDLMDWKTAQFMENHLGEEYDALIISVQKFGFFVELMQIFVEGLVGINNVEEFTGEPCFYRERDHAIVSGRSKTLFRVGGLVRVRADRIDPVRQRVEFALVRAEEGREGTSEKPANRSTVRSPH